MILGSVLLNVTVIRHDHATFCDQDAILNLQVLNHFAAKKMPQTL